MAYAALVSLKQTIHRLLNSSRVSVSPPSREILDAVYEEAQDFQRLLIVLDNNDKRVTTPVPDADERQEMDGFHRKMREGAFALEDALETHLVDTILSRSVDRGDTHSSSTVSLDVTELKREIDSFTEMVKGYIRDHGQEEKEEENDDDDDEDDKGEEECDDDCVMMSRAVFDRNKSKIARFSKEEEDDHDVTSRSFFDGNKSKMTWFSKGGEDDVYGGTGGDYDDDNNDEEEEEDGGDYDDDDDDDITSRIDIGINKSKMVEFSEQVLEEDDNYEGDEGDDVKSRIDLGEQNSKMDGFSDIFGQIRDLLLVRQWPKPKIEMVWLVGMAGIGKTTLAKKVYEDPSISRRFDHLAWVTVGQKYHVKDIFQRVLNQVGSKTDGETTQEEDRVITKGDENGDDVEEDDALLLEVYNNYLLAQDFYENLQDKGTYLIVFDDVWDQHIFDSLQGSLPFDSNYRILILSTTRRDHVGASGDRFKLRLLNSEESWDLLREKVFGEGSPCPPELVKAGKKIAENCEGLPLTIVTIADILSKADYMNPEYWNSVAEKENSVFPDAYDRMYKVLYPSYEKLPQHFKALFLYLAIFPQNYEINVTKLSMLWAAEGFFDASQSKDLALTCLEDFVLSNLVLERQSNYDYTLKTCTLHSVFWYLCVREAGRNKLFHVLKKSADSSAQGMQNQRRLCIHNNVLFGIKDAYKSMASSSTSRSLICTGP